MHLKSTEKATQAVILEWLTWKRIFHWRRNSGAFRTERGGFYLIGINGAPDIFAIKDGTCYGIEVKDSKGRQNENQIAFQLAFEEAGGVCIVARSLDDVSSQPPL